VPSDASRRGPRAYPGRFLDESGADCYSSLARRSERSRTMVSDVEAPEQVQQQEHECPERRPEDCPKISRW
jgi:hypothetical protein